MRSHAVRLALALLGVALLRADDSFAEARHAQALLGPDVWSEVVRIENAARFSVYPRVTYALVFELVDELWFYCAADGTQSLSIRRGRLAQDKADLGPLLKNIEPAFGRWSVVPDAPDAAPPPRGRLRNGCFVESVAALRERLAAGEEVGEPRLLAFYFATPNGLKGHTVLAFASGGHSEVIDPEQGGVALSFAGDLLAQPLKLAGQLTSFAVAKARVLPLVPPMGWLARFAAARTRDAEG